MPRSHLAGQQRCRSRKGCTNGDGEEEHLLVVRGDRPRLAQVRETSDLGVVATLTCSDQRHVKATTMAASDSTLPPRADTISSVLPTLPESDTSHPTCSQPTVSNSFCPCEIVQIEETQAIKFDCCLADRSPGEFLSTNVSGHTVWLSTPAFSLLSYVKHCVQCYSSSHDLACKTSACIVVPHSRKWHSYFYKLLRGMRLVRQFRKGSPFLSYQGKLVTLCCECFL